LLVVEATAVAVALAVPVEVELSQPAVVRTVTPTGVQMFWAKAMVAADTRQRSCPFRESSGEEGRAVLTVLVGWVALLRDAAGEVVDPLCGRADACDVELAGAARLGEVDAAALIEPLATVMAGECQRTAQDGRPEVSTWAATEAARERTTVMKRMMDGVEVMTGTENRCGWRIEDGVEQLPA